MKHVHKALRLMNGFITEILDPNMNYSRLSFLESSKQAIDIKYELGKGKAVGDQLYKMPSIANKYYTRSTLIQNLYEVPSDGRNRARYSDNLEKFKQNLRMKEIQRQCRNVKNLESRTSDLPFEGLHHPLHDFNLNSHTPSSTTNIQNNEQNVRIFSSNNSQSQNFQDNFKDMASRNYQN